MAEAVVPPFEKQLDGLAASWKGMSMVANLLVSNSKQQKGRCIISIWITISGLFLKPVVYMSDVTAEDGGVLLHVAYSDDGLV